MVVYVWGMMKKIRTNIHMSKQQRDHLKAHAKRYGISMSEYMRRVIDRDREGKL